MNCVQHIQWSSVLKNSKKQSRKIRTKKQDWKTVKKNILASVLLQLNVVCIKKLIKFACFWKIIIFDFWRIFDFLFFFLKIYTKMKPKLHLKPTGVFKKLLLCDD